MLFQGTHFGGKKKEEEKGFFCCLRLRFLDGRVAVTNEFIVGMVDTLW